MNFPLRIDRCQHCQGELRQRSIEQNDRFHAMLQDISEQKQWTGQWLDVETWKRLMVCAWERIEGRSVAIYPRLDAPNHGFDVVYSRTSRMSKQEMSSLIEYATAWAIDAGVQLRDRPH